MAPQPTCLCGSCAKCERRVYMRAWYRKGSNAERQRASQAASRARRLETVREFDRQRGYRVYDQQKVEARRLTLNAIRRGELQRKPCERCGEAKSEAHHPDYSRPLDVVWLCRKCHGIEHRKVA